MTKQSPPTKLRTSNSHSLHRYSKPANSCQIDFCNSLSLLESTMAASRSKKSSGKAGQRSAIADVVAREYTIHLHRRIYGLQFKRRAKRAIVEVKRFAEKAMGTKDVRLDPQLNKKVWESGIKGAPYRLRVRISRKRNDEEGAKEKLYSYVQAVNVRNAKGLQTAVVEDA